MNKQNKIDDLFREAMTGYRVEPSLGLWRRIERRFFPPSKFRPSGLITSIMLLMVAGLMPWLLIPANEYQDTMPHVPEGILREGYLIQSSSAGEISKNDGGNDEAVRTFTIKPTVFLESPDDPAVEPESQLIASANDPLTDPAVQPIIRTYKEQYAKSQVKEPEPEVSFFVDKWIYRMDARHSGLIPTDLYIEEVELKSGSLLPSSFTDNYENEYFKKAEFSAGLNFNPSIVFYEPNPYNKMLGTDAVAYFKIASFSLMTGVGYSRMEDICSYQVDYVTNDSVGYYLRVIAFVPDPRNPGEVEYIVRQEPIYDSVEHFVMADKTNYYSYIDIPLAFGYTFFQNKRITLNAEMGLKFSLLVHEDEPEVDFWISDAELINIERNVPARLNTNWRFTAGVDFGYLVTDKFSLHIEPVFEQYISPLYAEQPGYKPKKPYVTGVKAGIRYNF